MKCGRGLHPLQFTIANARERFAAKGDLFAGVSEEAEAFFTSATFAPMTSIFVRIELAQAKFAAVLHIAQPFGVDAHGLGGDAVRSHVIHGG